MGKRIAVIGAGAIGGYTGGHLAHNGFDVILVDPWPEHVETIRKDGLAIEGVTQEEFVLAHPRTLHLTELAAARERKAGRHRDGLGQKLRHRMGDDD